MYGNFVVWRGTASLNPVMSGHACRATACPAVAVAQDLQCAHLRRYLQQQHRRGQNNNNNGDGDDGYVAMMAQQHQHQQQQQEQMQAAVGHDTFDSTFRSSSEYAAGGVRWWWPAMYQWAWAGTICSGLRSRPVQ